MKSAALILAVFSIGFSAHSQSQVTIKTHPLRYVYGFNLDLSYEHNEHVFGVLYQKHDRDYMGNGSMAGILLGPLGLMVTLIPEQERASGYAVFFTYQKQLKDGFYTGPRYGLKQVLISATDHYLFLPDQKFQISESKHYLLWSLSKRIRYNILAAELYLHSGISINNKHKNFLDQNGSVVRTEEDEVAVLPHILFGFNIGLGFGKYTKQSEHEKEIPRF